MGSQTPRIHVMPEYESTYGHIVAEMMADYGLTLDEWQENIMCDWFAVDAEGKYAASPCGLSVPRQNGKSADVRGRCVGGMLLFSETILFTAHEVKTARKQFEEMAELFDPNGLYPDLAAQVDYIRRANGQEEIKLLDYQDDEGEWHEGGRVIFSARSRGAARGFTCDVLICDEAQELTAEQMAALMPTISAGKRKNSQVIMLGTPPAPGNVGEVFVNTRKAALSDAPGKTTWSEWSVDEIGDISDWERVEATNPALDIRLMRNAVDAEMSSMPADYFARERLGWWSEQVADAAIDIDMWSKCATETPPENGLTVYSVKTSLDNGSLTIAACRKPQDGVPHVELVATKPTSSGVTWAVDWLYERRDKAAQVVIDGQGTAQAIYDSLSRMGVPRNLVIRTKSNDMSAACSSLVNAVNEKSVTHFAQPELDDAVRSCPKRPIGSSGGFGFGGDMAEMLEAAALAMWGAVNTKRDPSRKQRML